MSKIILFLPGNIYHSNIIAPQLKRLVKEKASIKTLHTSPIPLVFGWQKIDMLLKPKIYKAGEHELCSGSLTHILHPLLTAEQSAWQTLMGVKGSIDVTFYPEFAPPYNSNLIPTTYFFLLKPPATRFYKFTKALTVSKATDITYGPAIKAGDKIGIFIDTQSPLRKAWHIYQDNPDQGLTGLIDATKQIADGTDPIHLTCWDLEAPYVGSEHEANMLWERYFEALEKHNLTPVFSPLKKHLKWLKKQAVKLETPQRILAKWTSHTPQLDYIHRAYYQFENKVLSKQHQYLRAIARSSDVMSAMHSKILTQDSSVSKFNKMYRNDILKLGEACLDILNAKQNSLDKLVEADPILGPKLIKLLRELA